MDIINNILKFDIFIKIMFHNNSHFTSHIKCYLNNYYFQYLTMSELKRFYHVDLHDILTECIKRFNISIEIPSIETPSIEIPSIEKSLNEFASNEVLLIETPLIDFIKINNVYRIYNCNNLDQSMETNIIDYNCHDKKFVYVSTNNNPDVLFLYNNGHIAFEEEILYRFGNILYDVLNEHFEHRWDGQIEIIKILKKKRI